MNIAPFSTIQLQDHKINYITNKTCQFRVLTFLGGFGIKAFFSIF